MVIKLFEIIIFKYLTGTGNIVQGSWRNDSVCNGLTSYVKLVETGKSYIIIV